MPNTQSISFSPNVERPVTMQELFEREMRARTDSPRAITPEWFPDTGTILTEAIRHYGDQNLRIYERDDDYRALCDRIGCIEMRDVVNAARVVKSNGDEAIVCAYRVAITEETAWVFIESRQDFDGARDWTIEQSENGEVIVCPHEWMSTCSRCGRNLFPHEGVETGSGLYCRVCMDSTEECTLCHNRSESMNDLYSDDGEERFLGRVCDSCVDNDDNIFWDEDDECYRRINQNNRSKSMQKYLNPNGVLADYNIIGKCPDCAESEDEICVRHMRQKIKEIEKERTTLWIYDNKRRNYHDPEHNRFKTLKLACPHEKPYLYYGAEFEWLFNWQMSDRDKIVREIIDASGGLFVAEYDRSVDELGNGSEFITRPMSYEVWKSDMVRNAFKKVEEVCKKYKIFDPQPTGCGLHIHMSRKFFENNTKKSVEQIKSDMDWFFHYYQKEFEKISQRKYTKYCTSKQMRVKDSFREQNLGNVKGSLVLEKGKILRSEGSGWTHHECINETRNTIEARTFISLSHYEDALAIIEFCRALAHAARNSEDLEGKTLADILYAKDSKYLQQYLEKIKGLKLNRKFSNKMEVKL